MPLLYCQNNVIRVGEFANCDVKGALLPPMYYRWPGAMDVTCTKGNEGKWFRAKRCSALNRETPNADPIAAQKKLQSERGNLPPGMPIYIGAFFPACAWYPR